MELQGKIINFLGDSITEGCGASSKETGFVSLIQARYGLAEARNYGIGGTRIAVQKTPSANPRWDLDFISRVDTMDERADAVFVFGGTNDFGHGDAPFGKFGDKTPDTFYGALYTLMEKLLNRFPEAAIVIATPLHRAMEEQEGKNPLGVYAQAIREVAAYFGLPLLDLYAASGLQPQIPIVREKFCPDGLHPNDAGHARLADRIARFLMTL